MRAVKQKTPTGSCKGNRRVQVFSVCFVFFKGFSYKILVLLFLVNYKEIPVQLQQRNAYKRGA